MIRKQDFGVLLFYYLGYSRARKLCHKLKHKQVARFITFHDVLPEALESFKAKLRYLKNKTNVISLDDFASQRLSAKKLNIAITFDDGYKSWVSDIVPLLRKSRLPATFFLSSGLLGLDNKQAAEFMRGKLFSAHTHRKISGVLSHKDVKVLIENGFIIGGHTMNHCNLGEIRDSSQLRSEILMDKIELERITGRRINYFAYPSGSYRNPKMNIIDVLKESRYRAAVTTLSGFNSAASNPYLLKRELTDAKMPLEVFKARVNGNYDAVALLKKFMLCLTRENKGLRK